MSFISTVQVKGTQNAAQLKRQRETAQWPQRRRPPPSVYGPSGPQPRRRFAQMRESSPRTPNSRRGEERGPFTSSSSHKRKSTQREKRAGKGLRVCPGSSNNQWDLLTSYQRLLTFLKWTEWIRWQRCICFDRRTRKGKGPFLGKQRHSFWFFLHYILASFLRERWRIVCD